MRASRWLTWVMNCASPVPSAPGETAGEPSLSPVASSWGQKAIACCSQHKFTHTMQAYHSLTWCLMFRISAFISCLHRLPTLLCTCLSARCMRRVKTLLHGQIMHGNPRLSTTDGLPVKGFHLHRHVALHRTPYRLAAQGLIIERWLLSELEGAAPFIILRPQLAFDERHAEGEAQHSQQHTWLARFGSLKPSKVVPLAFAAARSELVTSLASLIIGTNSTPEGMVSPCMQSTCTLMDQGSHRDHKRALIAQARHHSSTNFAYQVVGGRFT